MKTLSLIAVAFLAVGVVVAFAELDDDFASLDKRAMRNALVRFGRSGSGMRNALVRFGKRGPLEDAELIQQYALEAKRNGVPQPFVRFGRSAGHIDHIHDILSTLQKLENANSK